MSCVICKNGQTKAGHTTVIMERQATTLVYREVPAEVCDNCGEAYVDEQTSARLLQEASAAAGSGVELEVHKYHAA